jgi:hypothetical protein
VVDLAVTTRGSAPGEDWVRIFFSVLVTTPDGAHTRPDDPGADADGTPIVQQCRIQRQRRAPELSQSAPTISGAEDDGRTTDGIGAKNGNRKAVNGQVQTQRRVRPIPISSQGW